MSRLRWPESTNSVSEKPGTIHGLASASETPKAAAVARTTVMTRRESGDVPLAVEI